MMDLLSQLLKKMVALGATDLMLSAGMAPAYRVHGKLAPPAGDPLKASQIETMAGLFMTKQHQESFSKNPELNVAINLANVGRFRVNVFRQSGEMAIVLRSIPSQIPSLSDLGLPQQLQDIAMYKRGLVLIVGSTGSGKSTSLAAMLNHRAQHDNAHIITIEDPIEYRIEHSQSMVNQREIGVDTRSYQQALMNSLRQSPDVLMIGEIRDRETMERCLEIADTGHLCLATLHAINANQAFERIVNLFNENERNQILHNLSHNIRAVISQRLVPNRDGTRALACEVLLYSLHISELIQKAKFQELKEAIERGEAHGMQTFDQSLYQLCVEGKIDQETALEYADSASNLRLKLRFSNGEDLKKAIHLDT